MTDKHPFNSPGLLMHRVLGIPEVLALIFTQSAITSLASGVRVNRTWFTIAIETLWKQMTEHRMLNSLLDQLGTRSTRIASLNRPWTYSGSAPPIECWDRFYLYSSLIEEINIEWLFTGHNEISHNAAWFLADAAHPIHGSLFPRLKSLIFSTSVHRALLACPLFFQARLNTLVVEYVVDLWDGFTSVDVPEIHEMLSAAVACCPHLKRLDICGDKDALWKCENPTFPALFGRLGSLETIRLQYTTLKQVKMFRTLAGLPHLRSLGLAQSTQALEQWSQESLPKFSFPQLRDLRASLSPELLIILIKPNFPLQSLVSLSLEDCGESNTKQLMNIIYDHPKIAQLALTGLRVFQDPRHFTVTPISNDTALPNAFCAISSLRQLQRLIICFEQLPYLTDGDIILLVSGCSVLQWLELKSTSTHYPTLRSIEFLLNNFPDLAHLDIVVDARKIPESAKEGDRVAVGQHRTGTCQHTLEICASGWYCDFNNADPAVEFISPLCARYQTVICKELPSLARQGFSLI